MMDNFSMKKLKEHLLIQCFNYIKTWLYSIQKMRDSIKKNCTNIIKIMENLNYLK